MATQVYTTEEVTLQDGSTVELRPLNIKTLRLFMNYMDEFGKSSTEDEGLEVLLAASALSVSKGKESKWFDPKKERSVERKNDSDEAEKVALTQGGHTDEWEEVVDIPTVYHILDVCGGVKLNDPNLMAAAMEALGKD